MYRILICEDERDIRTALAIYLRAEGYEVTEAADGVQAMQLFALQEFHLILMDIMMPRMDGITAMTSLRSMSNVPVILLTAKSEDTDKILGLNLGADDYITKPFNPVEVCARVRSCIRRYTQLGCSRSEPATLRVGNIELCDTTKTVHRDGEPVYLTPTEYDILHLLMSEPGRVLSPAEIYRRVWKEEVLSGEGTVAVHIRHLREKLEYDPGHPRHLLVVWGKGYKMVNRGGADFEG